MKKSEVFHAWARILAGRAPSLSIEITKECPLRCPGCYAFDPAHLGGTRQLHELFDFKGDELVTRVLALIDEYKPLHVSLVGGDPLVRYRELELLLPQIENRGVHTQVVTSAFRVIPAAWMNFKKLNVVISVDGLQPEHDARRKPATYGRILKNIKGTRITIHCTITSQIAERTGYLDAAIREMEFPPKSPKECIFARTTETISADLKRRVTPCQFGGDPDCERCGCIASMGLAAVGHYRVLGPLTAGRIFMASDRLGKAWRGFSRILSRKPRVQIELSPLNILEP